MGFFGCTIWTTMIRIPLLAACALAAIAADHVTLQSYPQAIATMYSLTDSAVPAALANAPAQAKSRNGATWQATSEGVWREDPKAPPADRKRYFASRRWLPDDHAVALLPDSGSGMWIRTETGVAHIEFPIRKLSQKAEAFEQRIAQRHNRHGFVASSTLKRAGDLSSNLATTTDNDGLWTAMYAAAECFRYAVTKSPEARGNARQAIEAVLKLEEITGVPGLPARSYISLTEARPRDGLWVLNPAANLLWKADTSSDEIVGHYLIFAIGYDLLPDPELKKKIAGVTTRMTDHILDHGLTLTDLHGQPTWWGRWDRQYFQSERGKDDSPLNAAQILSFLKTAHHITGNPRYAAVYRELALDQGYAKIMGTQRTAGQVINYSDEELSLLSYYPLMQYEKDPKLRKLYQQGLDQWWSNMPRQKNPLWHFIYASANPKANVNFADAVWTLQRIPMDLISWTISNSHRTDIEWEPNVDRFKRRQAKTLLPADERPVMKWNSNPFQVDGGNRGSSEDDGAFFLLPYWMGRYHRFLHGE